MFQALQILNMMTEADWESLLPKFQRTLIGLGSAARAYLKREAIGKGLTALASRLESDADILPIGGVQGGPESAFMDMSTPVASIPYTFNDTDYMFLHVDLPDWYIDFTKPGKKADKKPKIENPPSVPSGGKAGPNMELDENKSTVKLPRVGENGHWTPHFNAPPELVKWVAEASTAVAAMKRMAGLLSNQGVSQRMLRYVSQFERIILDVERSTDVGYVVIVKEHARHLLNAFRADYLVLSNEPWHIVDGAKRYVVSARHFIEVAGKLLASLVDVVEKKM